MEKQRHEFREESHRTTRIQTQNSHHDGQKSVEADQWINLQSCRYWCLDESLLLDQTNLPGNLKEPDHELHEARPNGQEKNK